MEHFFSSFIQACHHSTHAVEAGQSADSTMMYHEIWNMQSELSWRYIATEFHAASDNRLERKSE